MNAFKTNSIALPARVGNHQALVFLSSSSILQIPVVVHSHDPPRPRGWLSAPCWTHGRAFREEGACASSSREARSGGRTVGVRKICPFLNDLGVSGDRVNAL